MSDVALIFRKSRHLFKHMRKVLRKPNSSALLSFLRRVRVQVRAVATGESFVLPMWVAKREMLLLFWRTSERTYRVVVTNTDPEAGLKYHAVQYGVKTQPKVSSCRHLKRKPSFDPVCFTWQQLLTKEGFDPPCPIPSRMPSKTPKLCSTTTTTPPPPTCSAQIKYRTYLVLDNVTAKNALDDVFWMALYQMVLNPDNVKNDDTRKLYEILLPFLTGKPLEVSLVEAETAAKEGRLGGFGFWRSPQRSSTGSVRCTMGLLDYCLRSRGLSELKSKQVRLALRAQMVSMIRNDLDFVFPDANGEKVCRIACQQLSYCAVKLVEAYRSSGGVRSATASAVTGATGAKSNTEAEMKAKEGETKRSEVAVVGSGASGPLVMAALQRTTTLVNDVNKMLAACRKDQVDLHKLDLNSAIPSQFCDFLAWESPPNEPNPGQAVSLNRYVPVDFLQIPARARSRDEALRALWLTDRLAALIENQGHCVKNGGLLVFSLIQNVFTHVLPLPKPRGRRSGRSAAAFYRSRRAARRKKRAASLRESNEGMTATDGDDEDENPVVAGSKGSYGQKVLSKAVHEDCVWDADIQFQTQLLIMQTLERIMHHFVAAANAVGECRERDAVTVVVSGCMAIIADAVMRRRATDHPSEICTHLMGQLRDGRQLGLSGFGLSFSSFDTQTETLEVHAPELCVARTAVIDYFSSPQQAMLQKIFTWEDHHDVS